MKTPRNMRKRDSRASPLPPSSPSSPPSPRRMSCSWNAANCSPKMAGNSPYPALNENVPWCEWKLKAGENSGSGRDEEDEAEEAEAEGGVEDEGEEEEEDERGWGVEEEDVYGVGRGGMDDAEEEGGEEEDWGWARVAEREERPYRGMMSPFALMRALQTGQSPWPAVIHWCRHGQQYK